MVNYFRLNKIKESRLKIETLTQLKQLIHHRLRCSLQFFAVFCLLLLSSVVYGNELGVKQVTIGVLAYKGKIATLSQWTPTAKYLSNKIPSCQFTIVPLTLEEINQAINKEQLDFVLTNPGHYIQLQAKNNVTAMATLKTSYINHELFDA